jgi:two-component system cell cycle response regulator
VTDLNERHDGEEMDAREEEQAPVLLVIDDAPSMHRLLAVRLKDEGLEFSTAFSGAEGLEMAERHQPSLILLDIGMPDMDGFEVLHALKDNRDTTAIPVVMMSGSVDSSDKVRAFELGAMDYVTKPVDVPELRARIQSAIRISRLMKMLEQRAHIDGLTGLWNRKHFNERLEAHISSLQRGDERLALAMCDLDHFKRLNDTFGHPAGDEVLQAFAKLLNRELRGYDIACRYGGEEFALILPRTTREEARAVCDRIRCALECSTYSRFPEVSATGSFGVTDAPAGGEPTVAAWIEAADRAMYSAKDAGRNRVHVYGVDVGADDGSDLKIAG